MKKKISKVILIIVLLLSLGAGFWFTAIFRVSLHQKKIIVNGEEMLVWIADTQSAREQGLQNIIWLPKNSGMLFVFDQPGQYCFWNRNTLRSLKLIFMCDGKVTEEANLQSIWKGKQTICPVYDADSVLEVIN